MFLANKRSPAEINWPLVDRLVQAADSLLSVPQGTY